MSDFNLDMALAECRIVTTDELLASVPPCAEELLSARVLASSRANRVAAVKQAKERLAAAVLAERQAVSDLLDDLSTDELLAILPPSAIRDIVSAIVGDKR